MNKPHNPYAMRSQDLLDPRHRPALKDVRQMNTLIQYLEGLVTTICEHRSQLERENDDLRDAVVQKEVKP